MEELKTIPLLYADTGDSFITYIEEQIHYKLDFQLSINQVSEIIEFLYEGFGYSFILKSLVLDSIQKGDLKEVRIKNAPPCIIERYGVIERSNIKKEIIDSFIELLLE